MAGFMALSKRWTTLVRGADGVDAGVALGVDAFFAASEEKALRKASSSAPEGSFCGVLLLAAPRDWGFVRVCGWLVGREVGPWILAVGAAFWGFVCGVLWAKASGGGMYTPHTKATSTKRPMNWVIPGKLG